MMTSDFEFKAAKRRHVYDAIYEKALELARTQSIEPADLATELNALIKCHEYMCRRDLMDVRDNCFYQAADVLAGAYAGKAEVELGPWTQGCETADDLTLRAAEVFVETTKALK
jgi:hypothetical protein